jgi:hypothetical protein
LPISAVSRTDTEVYALTHGEGDLAVRIKKEHAKVMIDMQIRAPYLQKQEIQKLIERFYPATATKWIV